MGNKLNLMELLHIFCRWWILIVAIAILCGGAMYTYDWLVVKPSYVSNGNLLVSSINADGEVERDNITISALNASARLASDYAEIIKYDSILRDVASVCNSDVTAKQIASMLHVSVMSVDSSIISISVSAPTKEVAYDVAKAVMKIASEKLPVVANRPGSVVIVEQATPAVFVKSNPFKRGLIGLLGGFLLGLLLVVLIEMLDRRVKRTDNISAKYNVPVIGIVPTIKGAQESEE